jgi:hypothetical protein
MIDVLSKNISKSDRTLEEKRSFENIFRRPFISFFIP